MCLLFLLREVNRELKRMYINRCRYNERLNAKTDGSTRQKTRIEVQRNLMILFVFIIRGKVRTKENTCNWVSA